MFCFLLAALLPFLLIIVIYVINPTSDILNDIALKTIEFPAIYSSKSPLLSKVMDVYVKTSPFVAIFLFLNTYKSLRLKREKSEWYLLRVSFLFTFFYAILIYLFLCTDTELTSSAKMLKLMSVNDFFLSFFYISLYSIVFMFTYLYLWFCIGTFRAFKERW